MTGGFSIPESILPFQGKDVESSRKKEKVIPLLEGFYDFG